MIPEIPEIPLDRIREIVAWADDPARWIPIGHTRDLAAPIRRSISHCGMVVNYGVKYRREKTGRRAVGSIPLRHLHVALKPGLILEGFGPFLDHLVVAFGMQENSVMRRTQEYTHVLQRLFRI